MRVLITGSRDWPARALVHVALYDAWVNDDDDDFVVVHGTAPGADTYADEWGRLMARNTTPRIRVEPHPAQWELYGRRAGYLRNRKMVDLGADLCMAFIKDGSAGASMTVRMAEEAGIKVVRWTVEGDGKVSIPEGWA